MSNKKPKIYLVSCRERLRDEANFMSDDFNNFPHVYTENEVFPDVFYMDFSFYKENFGNKALVLVHGYRGIFESINRRYNTIIKRLIERGTNYDYIIKYFWPASWSSSVGFIAAHNRTEKSALALSNFLNFWQNVCEINQVPFPEITISAHSLGCLLSLKNALYHKVKYNYIFASPAVNMTELNEYLSVKNMENSNYVKIAITKNDPVLKYAYRMVPSNWFDPALTFVPENKYTKSFKALVDRRKVEIIDLTSEVKGHSGYFSSERYFDLFD